MIIRYKNSKNEIIDMMVLKEEIEDYWVDTVKMQVIMEIGGKKYIVFRSKVYGRLSKAIDEIHDFLEKTPEGFLDTTNLL